MQNAPSVTYPVGRSAFDGVSTLALASVSACALVWGGWSAWQSSPASVLWVRWLSGLGVWLVWVALAAWRWRVQPQGSLRWDAQAAPFFLEEAPGAWFWVNENSGEAPMPVEIERTFDGQSVLLLRLRRSMRPDLWVWPHRGADPARWDDFRRALVRMH